MVKQGRGKIVSGSTAKTRLHGGDNPNGGDTRRDIKKGMSEAEGELKCQSSSRNRKTVLKEVCGNLDGTKTTARGIGCN